MKILPLPSNFLLPRGVEAPKQESLSFYSKAAQYLKRKISSVSLGIFNRGVKVLASAPTTLIIKNKSFTGTNHLFSSDKYLDNGNRWEADIKEIQSLCLLHHNSYANLNLQKMFNLLILIQKLELSDQFIYTSVLVKACYQFCMGDFRNTKKTLEYLFEKDLGIYLHLKIGQLLGDLYLNERDYCSAEIIFEEIAEQKTFSDLQEEALASLAYISDIFLEISVSHEEISVIRSVSTTQLYSSSNSADSDEVEIIYS